MANVSTRVDDQIKLEAEKVACEIGISLSTAINVFLKRFVANNGFPFDVVAPIKKQPAPIVDVNQLDEFVKNAVSDKNNKGLAAQFTYLDPDTNQPITISRTEMSR